MNAKTAVLLILNQPEVRTNKKKPFLVLRKKMKMVRGY